MQKKEFKSEEKVTNIKVATPDEMKNELDIISSEGGVSRSEIVREAIRDYVFIRKFRNLRNKMIAKAQVKGIFTDEDVFKQIS